MCPQISICNFGNRIGSHVGTWDNVLHKLLAQATRPTTTHPSIETVPRFVTVLQLRIIAVQYLSTLANNSKSYMFTLHMGGSVPTICRDPTPILLPLTTLY